MPKINGRPLHFVFKIADRGRSVNFFRQVLGMKVLRHEEFAEGCEASCNGPYNTRWSKTMMGYGPEDNYFAVELTYNYPIRSYNLGNDFIGMAIKSAEALKRAECNNWPIKAGNILEAPGGFNFHIINEPQPTDKDPVVKVILASSNLQKTIEYWNGLLGFTVLSKDTKQKNVVFGFNENQAKLEFREIKESIEHGTGYGRYAFSCPRNQQPTIDEKVKAAKTTILVPLKELQTPGKAAVRVLILADPDGHEICVVDDESFRKLSEFSPDDEKILDRFIKKDDTGELKKQDERRQAAFDAAKAKEASK